MVDWFDQRVLYALVFATTLAKISDHPEDHAVLVGCVSNHNNNNNNKPNSSERLIGMVEVSRQPVLPARNPPPYPLPLWYKRLVCRVTDRPLEGWITNLLVCPEFRGRGWSKVLVAASEGRARPWRCSSMHLHCEYDDSDSDDGSIPQRLYTGLQYQMLRWDDDEYQQQQQLPWMMQGSAAASSIFVVQGVPLLYLRKNLVRVAHSDDDDDDKEEEDDA